LSDRTPGRKGPGSRPTEGTAADPLVSAPRPAHGINTAPILKRAQQIPLPSCRRHAFGTILGRGDGLSSAALSALAASRVSSTPPRRSCAPR
jgi:hypothetical protein